MLTRQLRPWFFYLLDYIASAEISKCGDQKKKEKLLMYLSTPAEFFITFLTTSKKYEICMLTTQLRPWFFYLLDYIASAEISKCGNQKKNPLMYLSTPAEFFITFLRTFQKKYEICLQENLGFFYLLD